MKDKSAVTQRAAQNNLDSLRLILASLVVLEHANNLFHVAKDDPHRFGFFLLNMSDVAVSTFFVISGMLTYVSYKRDPDIIRFYLRRMFRIFPAYWVVVLLQVAAFCLVATAFVKWEDLPFYISMNALTANFISPTFVDGVSAINGSLWTIKIEASYYILLPLIFPILNRTSTLLLLAIISMIWAVGLENAALAKQLPGKLYLFAAGIFLSSFSTHINRRHSLISMLSIPVLVYIKFALDDISLLGEMANTLTGIFLVIAFMHPWVKREPMDISYTLYLVHYPILVLITKFIAKDLPFIYALTAGATASILVAVLVSIFIERPALKVGRTLVSHSRDRPSSRWLRS